MTTSISAFVLVLLVGFLLGFNMRGRLSRTLLADARAVGYSEGLRVGIERGDYAARIRAAQNAPPTWVGGLHDSVLTDLRIAVREQLMTGSEELYAEAMRQARASVYPPVFEPPKPEEPLPVRHIRRRET